MTQFLIYTLGTFVGTILADAVVILVVRRFRPRMGEKIAAALTQAAAVIATRPPEAGFVPEPTAPEAAEILQDDREEWRGFGARIKDQLVRE